MLTVTSETWALREPFVIARGARTETQVIKVELSRCGHTGRGEATPTPYYGESVESVREQIESIRDSLLHGLSKEELPKHLPAGAARNAVDCALWDLEAKKKQTTVNKLLNLPYPNLLNTTQTISIGTDTEIKRNTQMLSQFPLLKLKLNANNILGILGIVKSAAPNAKILIDANESWNLDLLVDVVPHLKQVGVVMIEQPLPAGQEHQLRGHNFEIPIGADESCHTSADIIRLKDVYDVINIKLDKAGGLTEAVNMANIARKAGLEIMVGCMLGTSLAIAPAMILATLANYVDLDAPALLQKDRDNGFIITNGRISRLNGKLWGGLHI